MFDHSWGMGSSSALVANLARWAMTEPFELFSRLYNGSGYDIAAALAESPILFSYVNHKAKITPVKFLPVFHTHISFIYTGHKQNTESSLEAYRRLPTPSKQQIEMMNYFTGELFRTQHLKQFMQIMNEHEAFLSRILDKKTVKEELFTDFDGEIKSLGAWGGDMVMAASEKTGEYIRTYFETKGYQTVFDFHTLILS
jgi:mevalonate kinase